MILILVVFFLSLISKIYKFSFKYPNDDKTYRMKCIVLELEKVKDDKISYLVKYNRRQVCIKYISK